MKHIRTIFGLILLLASCSSTESVKNPAKEGEIPETYEIAFEKAFGPQVSISPDTLALGYYWGMTKTQTNAHVKNLAQSNKVHYKKYKGYTYTMPLTHFEDSGNKTDDYTFRVTTKHYNDTLQELHLWLKGTDNNRDGSEWTTQNRDLTMIDLYTEFRPIFEAKGFLCKEIDPEETLTTDPQHGIPAVRWKGTEYRFVKGNTLIRLWRGEKWWEDYCISYYDMSVVYKEHQDIAAKEAAAAKKAAEENATREEKKKDFLNNF